MSNNLSKSVAVDQVLGYFAAGTTKRTSSIIDMAGYEGVMFIAGLGTTIENGTLDVYVEQHTLNQTSGMARLATTTVHTVTAANAALTQSAVVVDVYRPRERYLQINITPADQNAVILGVTAIRYNGKLEPSTLGTQIKQTLLVEPTEA